MTYEARFYRAKGFIFARYGFRVVQSRVCYTLKSCEIFC